MPRTNTLRIFATIGGTKSLDITDKLTECPILLAVLSTLAHLAAREELLGRLADCGELEDGEVMRRKLRKLASEAARLEAVIDDNEGIRKLRVYALEAARFLKEIERSCGADLRVVRAEEGSDPRETLVGVNRGGSGSIGDRDVRGPDPNRPA